MKPRWQRPARIVGLFPELLGVGGIQEAGRLTALALRNIALRMGWSTEFLSLNDRPSQVLSFGDSQTPFRGFGRSKLHFTRSAIQLTGPRTQLVLAAHPHLAVPAAQMKLLKHNLSMITISHGIEVWSRLPWLRRFAFRRSDRFLAPSQYTAHMIAEMQGVPDTKIRRLPWPLSPEVFRMAGHPEKLPLPPGFPRGLVVLTVARLSASEQYKGVDKLITATALLRTRISNLHLVVVGGGDDLARHVKLASDFGVPDCVHFFDNLSRAEIGACYFQADAFAMPSIGEGFGLVFLEAMAFAKPVIGATAGGIPDVVEDGINGFLVRPGDFDQLCQALRALLTNEQLRKEFGAKGFALARTKYQFENFSAELESILRDCGLELETY